MKRTIFVILLPFCVFLHCSDIVFADLNIGIIDAIDRQVKKLNVKVEETKIEILRYSGFSDNNGRINFSAGSGKNIILELMDEEIPNFGVSNIKFYLYTDYYGVNGCYMLYDFKGDYIPYFSPITDKINMTYYPALHMSTGTTGLIINSQTIDSKNFMDCVNDLFMTLSYGKLVDLKKGTSLWTDKVANYFGITSVGKVDMVLVVDLGEDIEYTNCLSNTCLIGSDDFFYNFYINAGYKDTDDFAVVAPGYRIKSEIINSGMGIIMVLPGPQTSRKAGNLQVSGTVKDLLQNAVSDVEVQISPPVFPTNKILTDSQGNFNFYDLASGSYTITLAKTGYKRASEEVLPSETGLTFNLQPYDIPPVLVSTQVSSPRICMNQSTWLTFNIYDAEGDSPVFKWIPNGGGIEGSGYQVRWYPPSWSPGDYSITAYAYDYDYRSTRAEFSVKVIYNNAPVISSMTASPYSIQVNSTSTITCDAYDPDDDYIGYYWNSSTGTFTGRGRQVLWQAPSSTGTYWINCAVDDEKYGVTEDSVPVVVTP